MTAEAGLAGLSGGLWDIGTATAAEPAPAPRTIDARPWPRPYQVDGVEFSLYRPQIDAWTDNNLKARAVMAVKTGETPDASGKPVAQQEYGVLRLTARTETDKEAREVRAGPADHRPRQLPHGQGQGGALPGPGPQGRADHQPGGQPEPNGGRPGPDRGGPDPGRLAAGGQRAARDPVRFPADHPGADRRPAGAEAQRGRRRRAGDQHPRRAAEEPGRGLSVA